MIGCLQAQSCSGPVQAAAAPVEFCMQQLLLYILMVTFFQPLPLSLRSSLSCVSCKNALYILSTQSFCRIPWALDDMV